jgi:predicted glycosyltransferase
MISQTKKKVLIDIKHPAQLNLFKGFSKQLQSENWDVTICYLNRGKLPGIIAREYPGFKTVAVGGSNGTKWSIIWDGNIKRMFVFMDLIRKNSYDICVAASSIPLAIASRLTGVPVIQFYDDPERKLVNSINARVSNQIFFPPIVDKTSKVSIFNCLKEWSYLSPDRFFPDVEVLQQYELTPHEYIFAREVSNKSFNYYNQKEAIICSIADRFSSKVPVILSLEDKSLAGKYPGHWKILQEPVNDIHSLMYYSRVVISSGDSMAREGAMLGVPSIYCGYRNMKANDLLIKSGLLNHSPGESSISLLNEILSSKFNGKCQQECREKLLFAWDDMQLFMKNQLEKYSKRN